MAGCGSIPSTWEPETGGSQGQGQSGLCGSLSQKKPKKSMNCSHVLKNRI
jgi:hypothetical protein